MTRYPLDPLALVAARRQAAITSSIAIAVVVAAAFAIPALTEWRWLALVVAAGIALLGVLELVVLEPRAHRAVRYALLEHAIEIASGTVVQRRRHIPYRQVLIVERRAGPILRPLGLVCARLTLPEGSVDVVGIRDEAFERIRDAVELGHRDA